MGSSHMAQKSGPVSLGYREGAVVKTFLLSACLAGALPKVGSTDLYPPAQAHLVEVSGKMVMLTSMEFPATSPSACLSLACREQTAWPVIPAPHCVACCCSGLSINLPL